MKPDSEITIGNDVIGLDKPVYFIADVAANHDGSLERAKELIWKAKDAGAQAAKFQHFRAETIVSDLGFRSLGAQLSHQASWGKSVFEVYKDASVNLDWTQELKETCKKAGITFFTTPYSLDVIDFMDDYVPAYKIGSGDITWLEMIERVAARGKPYIVASGASSADEVYRAITAGMAINRKIVLMQCNTNYTASLENFKFIHLNVLNTYKSMFPGMVLGLSDHTPGHATVLGSVALGARVIEKHFTDDVCRDGPDHKFSMDPKTWREMVDRTRELELAMGNGVKKVEENERETVILQRRSLRANSNFKIGHIIKSSDFSPLRPCPVDALSPSLHHDAIGKVLLREISEGDYLRQSDITN